MRKGVTIKKRHKGVSYPWVCHTIVLYPDGGGGGYKNLHVKNPIATYNTKKRKRRKKTRWF